MILRLAALTVAFLCCFAPGVGEVNAYLDPGSGSILYQVLVGGLLAGTAALRIYWRKVRRLLRRERVPAKPEQDSD